MQSEKNKKESFKLRREGYSLNFINRKTNVPKSTLSGWFKNISYSKEVYEEIEFRRLEKLKKARFYSLQVRRNKRKQYFEQLRCNNLHLAKIMNSADVSKIALAVLYLGEGSKSLKRGSIVFGNSDPKVIKLFLHLLNKCYKIDETKFRCTVQCRADQKVHKLNQFWMQVTKIPFSQFYQARIDKRTINKESRNKDYKGVCRIDYFSAFILHDLLQTIEIIEGL